MTKAAWLHLALLAVWVGLCWPTFTAWSESIPWLQFMSIYAIISTHWSAFEAARDTKGG